MSQKSLQFTSALMARIVLAAISLAMAGMTLTSAGAQTLLVSVDAASSNIGSYNATTGAVINASYISGVDSPYQITADSSQIYAAEFGAGRVGVFDYSGTSVNTISVTSAIGAAVSGTNLYVSTTAGRVSRFNAQTGALINTNFVSGLTGLRNLLVDGSGNLFVAETSAGNVRKYDSTGAAVVGFATINLAKSFGLALDGNNLFVSDFINGSVFKYNAATGVQIGGAFVTGLSSGAGMEIYNNTLYVADYGAKAVKTYNATSGALLNASFITSSSNILDVLVIPEPSTLTMAFLGAAGLLFLGKRRAVRNRVSCQTL